MKTRSLIALLLCTHSIAPASRAQSISVDTAGVGAVLDQALNHSEVMQNLAYLSDMIGPRLTGSPAMKKANDWTMERFKAYGMEAHLESYTFGVTWERGDASLKLVSPFPRAITAHSWAWTAGTNGKTLTGEVIRINGTPGDSLNAYLPKVKGKWLMLNDPASIWNPDGPPMTAADSQAAKEAQEKRASTFQRLQGDPKAMQEFRQASYDRAYQLKAAGALGIITDGSKEQGLMNMSGSPNSVSPLPNLVVSHEDYAMFDRLIKRGNPPVLAGNVTNSIGTKPMEQDNTVGEIKGSDKPDEVVILGAHLDSWDLGTGVTDNWHRLHGGRGGGARQRAVGCEAEAHDSLHPVQRRGGGLARLHGVRGTARRRG